MATGVFTFLITDDWSDVRTWSNVMQLERFTTGNQRTMTKGDSRCRSGCELVSKPWPMVSLAFTLPMFPVLAMVRDYSRNLSQFRQNSCDGLGSICTLMCACALSCQFRDEGMLLESRTFVLLSICFKRAITGERIT